MAEMFVDLMTPYHDFTHFARTICAFCLTDQDIFLQLSHVVSMFIIEALNCEVVGLFFLDTPFLVYLSYAQGDP